MCSVIPKLLCRVTPRILSEVTLARPGQIGRSGTWLRVFLKIISQDLEGLRRRLFSEAQESMWASSEGIEAELVDGTIRYVSSAYLQN